MSDAEQRVWSGSFPLWTDEEKHTLRTMWRRDESPAAIGAALGRTPVAVASQARNLGLSKRKNGAKPKSERGTPADNHGLVALFKSKQGRERSKGERIGAAQLTSEAMRDDVPAVTLPSWPAEWCARVDATLARVDERERERDGELFAKFCGQEHAHAKASPDDGGAS